MRVLAVACAILALNVHCAGRPAPPATVDVVAAAPSSEPKAPAKRGRCAVDTGKRYVAPPDARTLVTPPPERTIRLEGGPVWRGAFGATAALLRGVSASGTDVLAVGSGKLLRSRDAGATFEEGTSPITASIAWAGGPKDMILAGGRSIAHSSDSGATWSVHEPFAIEAHVQTLAGDGSDLFAAGGTTGKGVLLAHSADRGATWNDLTIPEVDSGWLHALATRSGEVFVGGYKSGARYEPVLARSNDCGMTWARLAPPSDDPRTHEKISGLCALPSRLVVATSYAIWITDDNGASWTRSVEIGAEVLGLACRGDEIFASGRSGSLFHSPDGGKTWSKDVLDGLSKPPPSTGASALESVHIGDDGAVYVVGEGSVFARLAR